MTETDNNGALEQLDAPATEPITAEAVETWRVDKHRSLCRGRHSLLYFLRPQHPMYRAADLLPQLDAGGDELRKSDELAALNLVRKRHAAAVAEVDEIGHKHMEAMNALSDGAADPNADMVKLQRVAEKIAHELQQKESLVRVLAEEWTLRRQDVELKAKEIEASFEAISHQGFQEIAQIREEIGHIITPLLDRWSLVMETISRNSRMIPNKSTIIGPNPPTPTPPERHEEEEVSPFFGVPFNR